MEEKIFVGFCRAYSLLKNSASFAKKERKMFYFGLIEIFKTEDSCFKVEFLSMLYFQPQ